MANVKLSPFFVSEKISAVRWVPEELQETERFLTGSWDMPQNFLRIWRLRRNQYADEDNEYVPRCADKVSFQGDVTGLEFLDADTAVASCSSGTISVVKIKRAVEEDVLREEETSPVLHKFNSGKGAPCTGVSIYNKDIATVGEDGRLNIMDASDLRTPRRTLAADSCAITAVVYVNPQEVLTSNRMGVIRMFDIRSSSKDSPSISFMTSSEDEKRSNYVSCMASHPTQQHIVLVGSEEGSITVWDLREPGCPASYLSAHESPITDIGFHRTDPSKVFTASEAGELWMWAERPLGDYQTPLEVQEMEGINPWLNGERTKNRIGVTSLIANLRKAVNSFDTHGSRVICGSDSEAVYFVNHVL